MEKDKVNFYGPGLPWIIVQKLTKEIIQEAIKAYIDDKPEGYWLKLYHFALDIDIAVLNQIQAQEIEESAQFNLLIGLDDLKAKINKLDKLDKSKKSDLVASLDKLYKYLRIITQKEKKASESKLKNSFQRFKNIKFQTGLFPHPV